MKVNILGTIYTVFERFPSDDEKLKSCDGYCDKTTKEIVVTKETPDSELGNWGIYRNKILRHEIIHAFLFESGLHENFKHEEWGHDETTVDWIACQFPKILDVYKKVGCI